MKTIQNSLVKCLLLPIFLILITTSMWADISGTIFRDFNLNGTQDTLEPGISGLTVTAYNETAAVSSQTTDANGNYIVTAGAGKYRVEITNIPSYLKAGTAISGTTAALVSMVDNGTIHNIGLSNAGEYCQADPDIIITRFTKGAKDGANSNINTVLQFSYAANGTDVPIDLSSYSNVGAVYGVAHLKKAKVTYLSTYFKRHTDIGPSGIGAIYKLDHTNGNAISTFVTLPGTDPRNASAGYDWAHDTNGYTSVGKTGIGDIELSDDESQLFAVNMNDKKLYIVDVDANGNAGAMKSISILNPCATEIDFRPMGLGFHDGLLYVGVTCTAESTVSINDPDDSYGGPRHGDKSGLSAHIYRFDPAQSVFTATPVVNIDLTYGRGCSYDGDISNVNAPNGCYQFTDKDGGKHPFVADWNPWQLDPEIVFNDKRPGNIGNQDTYLEYQQPLLSDIEFDNDGSMMIQIKDINGDRTGHNNHAPDTNDMTTQNGNSYGDILRACGNAQAGWTLENNGQCGGITTGGADSNQGLGGGEYYWYDNGPGGNGNINGGTAGHPETTMGGLLHIAGYPDVITGVMDAHGTNGLDNGLMWLRNDTGEISTDAGGTPKRLLVSRDNGDAFYGKASGIGDIEALCDPAPIEIGDYVWQDTDVDGIQDPNEAVLTGVTINLYEGATLVGIAVTGANGEYYFGGSANTNMIGENSLKPLTAYQLRIDLNDANLGSRVPTQKDVNGNADDLHDSDGDNGTLNTGFSTIAYTTATAGSNDHTLDFGFTNPVAIGSLIWNDSNNNGKQDAGEKGIAGAKVELLDENGNPVPSVPAQTTGADGKYCFCDLPEGKYKVKVTPPSDYLPSATQNDNADDNTADDSNIKDNNGDGSYTSSVVELKAGTEPENESTPISGSDTGCNCSVPDKNSNATVDFGFVTIEEPESDPTYHIGTHFWIDEDKDSLFDSNEKPIDGALVELFDENGNKLRETHTANGGEYGFDVPAGSYYVVFHIPNTPEYEGYVFSDPKNNSNNNTHINKANQRGITQSVTVGPNSKTQDLTLDAGINCGCSGVSGDSGDALSIFGMLGMMFMTLFAGLLFVKEEEQHA